MIRDLVGRLKLRWRMVLLAAAVVTIILLVAGVVLTMGLRTVLTHSAIRAAARSGPTNWQPLRSRATLPTPSRSRGRTKRSPSRDRRAGRRGKQQHRWRARPAGPRPRSRHDAGRTDPQPADRGRRPVRAGQHQGDRRVGPGRRPRRGVPRRDRRDRGRRGRVGAVGLPVLVLALSAAMWLVVGRTLRPIDVMRRKADDIHGDALARRVPEPARLDEVGRLARTINGMLGRIQSSVERQRRFVGDAAHELRSPTASLRTTLETALESSQGVDWQEVGTDLLHETLRMQRLTDQLLLLARLDASTIDAHSVDVDLDHLIEQVAAQVRPDVAVDISAVEPVQVTGEPTLLLQVIQNLLDNAARHTTTSIQIALHRDGDQAVITIDDDGPGIPTDRRDHLFERFTRLDQARDRDHGGAGLGLAIVADIVTVHGGTVRIEDPPDGRGARLVVRLPV